MDTNTDAVVSVTICCLFTSLYKCNITISSANTCLTHGSGFLTDLVIPIK